jgi:hypothetical protein
MNENNVNNEAFRSNNIALNEIMSNLNYYSYDELAKIYENLSQDSSIVFSEQFSIIRDRKYFLENAEVAEIINKINNLELDELSEFRTQLNDKKFTKQSYQQIDNAIENRRVICCIAILDIKAQKIESMEREEVDSFIEEVNADKLPNNIAIDYLNRAYAQADFCEKKELDAICGNLESLAISELESLLKYVRSSRFKPGNSNEYSARVLKVLNALYSADLDVICADINIADLGKAREINKALENYICPPAVKDSYRQTVEARITLLLKAQFEALVENLDDKNLQELVLLKEEISKKEYAQFMPEYYIHRTDVLLGRFVYSEFGDILYNIASCTKGECLNKREEVKMYSFWSPAARMALEIINNRILYLDLRDLESVCSDVNTLNREDIIYLRERLKGMAISEQALKMFSEQLRKREENIALKMISTLAVKFNRIMTAQQIDINGMHISIEPDYLQAYAKFASTYSVGDIFEMPFFILDSGLSLAMSINHIYYKSNGKLFKAVIRNVRSFETVKNLLADSLVINLKDGSKITLSGSINRKISGMFTNILNEMILSITDPDRMRTFTPISYTVQNIDITKYEKIPEYTVNYVTCIREMSHEIEAAKSKLGLGSGLYHCFDPKWASQVSKMKNALGVTYENRFIMMYDNTLLGTGKEGIIIGARGIYYKQGNFGLVSIAVKDVIDVRKSPNKLAVEIKTKNNGVYIVDKALGSSCNYEIFAKLLFKHITNMQVLALIDPKEAEDAEKPVTNINANMTATVNTVVNATQEFIPAAAPALNLGIVPELKKDENFETSVEEMKPLVEEISAPSEEMEPLVEEIPAPSEEMEPLVEEIPAPLEEMESSIELAASVEEVEASIEPEVPIEEEEAPTQLVMPIEEEAPTALATSIEEEAPTALVTPIEEEAPTVLVTPIEEEAPTQLVTPIEEEAPTQLVTPIEEEAPTQLVTPIEEEAPTQLVTPIEEEAPIQLVTPIEEEAPTQLVTPIEEEAPTQLVTPIEEEAPTQLITPIEEEPSVELAAPDFNPVVPENIIPVAQAETPKFCTACGAKTLPNAKFCTKCGNRLI